MGKTLTAAQMLSAGRKRPPTPAETGTEPLDHQASTNLDHQASEPLDDGTTSALDHQASEPLDDGTTSALDHQASTHLDAQTTEPLNDGTTSALDNQTTKPPGTQLVERVNTAPNDRRGNQSSKRLSTQSESTGQPSATYQRVTVFVTPAQRQWLKLTAKQLPDGLSASDIVRLAISRLTLDVTDGVDLVTNLTDQAHSDAEIFSGRRNRGLPPRADISA
jgi:hypothetical protein